MPESADLPQLLAQAAAGDETALSQLFSRYRKRLKDELSQYPGWFGS